MPSLIRVVLALLGTGLWLAAVTAAQQQPAGTGVVAGQVIDASTRAPVADAVVTLSAAGQPPPSAAQTRRGVAVANADGRFVFRDVPAGSYSITATLDGYAPGASGRRRPNGPGRPFTLADGARFIDATIAMWRLAVVSGTVRDDRGEPVIGAAVRVMRRAMNGGRVELTLSGGGGEVTDDRGQYRAPNLLPGSYVMTVRLTTQSASVATANAYRAAVTSGTSGAMRRDWIETGGVFEGRPGLAVEGWQVSVSSGIPQPLPGPGGTLLVHPTMFFANANSPADATVITLAAGDDRSGIDLTLPLVRGVRVAGVLAGPDGPAANHGVRLFPAASGEPVLDIPAAYAITDAGGRFAFLGIPPGAYVARAHRVQPSGPIRQPAPPAAGGVPVSMGETLAPRPGATPPALFAETPVTVGSTHIEGVALALQPGARVSGRVVFDGATPAPPAARLQQIALSIQRLNGAVPIADTRVDAEGRFTTQGLPPGRYQITNVTPPGPEWTLATARIGGADAAAGAFTVSGADTDGAEFIFTDKVTTLTGTVRAADAVGNPEATVILFPADTQAWLAAGAPARRVVVAASSASGDYQLRVPLPGDYLVVAVPPDVEPVVDGDFIARFAPAGVRVTLARGESRTQPLTLGRPR